MRHVYGNAFATTTEMQGQYVQGMDIIVPPYKWAFTVKHLLPLKTAQNLAVIGNVDERTAKRWLAGEYQLPTDVFGGWLVPELLKREGQ